MARTGAQASTKPVASTDGADILARAKDPFTMDVLMQGGPDIESAEEGDKPSSRQKLYEDPAFLNEIIVIQFLDTGNPNDPKAVELLVSTVGKKGKTGGKTQRMCFARNVPYKVPRYVFEVVAHAKKTTLVQTQDPRDPMNIIHVEQHSFSYPCQVLYDPNKEGPQWCKKVMEDPA